MEARQPEQVQEEEEASSADFTQSFPTELSLYLFGFLEFQDLLACLAVCRDWHGLAADDSFYRRIYIRNWRLHNLPAREIRVPISGTVSSWKELFVYRRKIEWKYFSKEEADPPPAPPSGGGGQDDGPPTQNGDVEVANGGDHNGGDDVSGNRSVEADVDQIRTQLSEVELNGHGEGDSTHRDVGRHTATDYCPHELVMQSSSGNRRVLTLPVTAKEFLSWGYELGIRLTDSKRKTRREKKEAGEWDTSMEHKKMYRLELMVLLVLACEEYASAVSVFDPSKEEMNILYIATNNWAISLAEQARMKEGPDSDLIFAASYKKFEQNTTSPHHPDLWWVLSEWAVTLRAHAARKMNDIIFKKESKRRERGHREREERKHKHKDSEGEDEEERRARRKILLRSRFFEENESEPGAENFGVDQLFDMSAAKIEEAHVLKPQDSQILSEWADGLSEHANYIISATGKTHIASPRSKVNSERRARATKLFEQSYEKYTESMRLVEASDQDRDIVLSNWGLALSDHAMIMDGEDMERLFEASYAKYELAALLKPNNKLTQCNLAMTYVLHSSLFLPRGKEEDTAQRKLRREAMWQKADQLLRNQLEKSYSWTYFCLARLASVRGHTEECKEWLTKCKHKNYLAKKTKWFAVHFENVKDLPWFIEIREEQLRKRRAEKLELNNLSCAILRPAGGDSITASLPFLSSTEN